MARYGLPYEDFPGIRSVEDLKIPRWPGAWARHVQERMGKGDVAANLGVTSLVTNAYLLPATRSTARGLWNTLTPGGHGRRRTAASCRTRSG